MIIDYSTARPPMTVLKAAGVTAVGRYIGWDGEPGFSNSSKNLTASEARLLRAAGIEIFLAFEYLPDAPARGAAQGTKDGQLAMRQLTALGAPSDMGVYFACDFDIPDYAPAMADTPQNALVKLGPVGQYFQAIKNLKYPYQVGVYGGYWAVKRVLDAGLATLGWQASAWSPRNLDGTVKVDPRAVIFQVLSAAPIADADIDVREHTATQSDYGQWKVTAVPTPTPVPTPTAIPDYRITSAPQGRYKGGTTGTFIGIGTDGNLWKTSTTDGVHWTAPVKAGK